VWSQQLKGCIANGGSTALAIPNNAIRFGMKLTWVRRLNTPSGISPIAFQFVRAKSSYNFLLLLRISVIIISVKYMY
jgi:hypothetical protein